MAKDGFGITKDGKPFYRVLGNVLRYPDTEELTLPNGKVVKREVTKEYQEPHRDLTPSEMGWAKKVLFEDIILLDVANPKNRFKLEKALFHRTYEIDVKEYYKHHKCNLCEHNGLASKFHYFRVMEAGVYTVCWLNATKFGRTASGPIQTLISREGDLASWVKMISDKVSKKKAKEILRRLQRAPNMDVGLYLAELKGMEVI